MSFNANFELPPSWIWVSLDELSESMQNGIYKPSNFYDDNGIACLRMYNIENGEIVWKDIKRMILTDEEISQYELKAGDLLINRVNSRELVGKTAAISDNLEICVYESKNIRLRVYKHLVEYRLIAFYFRINGQKFFNQNAQQTVGMASINQQQIASMPIPLPPLNEQRRIVSTIEQMTDRSNRARTALADVPKLIEQFRQSVLAAAFRGDLTADWREKNPDVEWETTILDNIIHGKPRNGYSPKPVDFPTNVKSLTLSSTTSGIFKPEYFKYIDEEISKDSYLWLTPGDILLQRGNTLEYVGTSAIYTGELFEFIYPDLMIKLQVIKEKALPEFIHYQLSSEATRKYFKSNATGTAGNMPKINQKIVMETPIFLPSLKEQLEIMKKIKQMFDGIELLQSVYIESDEELNQLDRSILAKAFRGELVPQDPNDEPAAVLLDRIRAEREQTTTPKQRGKTTKKNSSKQLSIEGIE